MSIDSSIVLSQDAAPPVDLNRTLKNRHIQLIALGGIIGSCYFLGTGAVVADIGPAVCLAYLLGGIIVYMVMQCLGELTVAMPSSGSFITYAAKFISPTIACGIGWAYWLNWVVYIPAECVAGGLIMQMFTGIQAYAWALLFGCILSVVNLSNVRVFGEVEYWLALIKIIALIAFSALALLIFFGFIHHPLNIHPISWHYIETHGGLFPKGIASFFTAMVLLLVNYQGTEIVGIVAGEAQNPEQAIPKAIRGVTYRILTLFIIPVTCLMLIFPWQDANLYNSVFAEALMLYGLKWAGAAISFVTLTAAFSSANSGFYSTVRTLHVLAKEGMAPKAFSKLSRHRIPQNAVLFSLAGVWLVLLVSYFFSQHTLYLALLLVSGFTGTVCWIILCWAQINFRRHLHREGIPIKQLKFRALGAPYTSIIAIILMSACLLLLVFSPDKTFKIAFILSCVSLIIPPSVYKLILMYRKKRKEKRLKSQTL